MTTVPRSIDSLPLELMQQISSLLQKDDLLKLRLIAPRTVLPFINALVFENLIIDIDGTDDLPRWVEAEADGVAIKRLQEVAASRISDHVRVLSMSIFTCTESGLTPVKRCVSLDHIVSLDTMVGFLSIH